MDRREEQKVKVESIFDEADKDNETDGNDDKKIRKNDGTFIAALGVCGIIYGLASWLFKGSPTIFIVGVILLTIGIIRIKKIKKIDADYYERVHPGGRMSEEEIANYNAKMEAKYAKREMDRLERNVSQAAGKLANAQSKASRAARYGNMGDYHSAQTDIAYAKAELERAKAKQISKLQK